MGTNICPGCKVLQDYGSHKPKPDQLCWKCKDVEYQRLLADRTKAMETSELIVAIVELYFEKHEEHCHSGGGPGRNEERAADAARTELDLRIPRRDGKKVG